jgi:hypothetical protein
MVRETKTGNSSPSDKPNEQSKATPGAEVSESLRQAMDEGLKAAESGLSSRERQILRQLKDESDPTLERPSLRFDLKEEREAWKEAGLGKKLRVERLGDDADFDALVERLEQLKLLGDKFLYTAANPIDLPMLREHGTYRLGGDGRPELAVFCCEYIKAGIDHFITQADEKGDPATRYTIWDYLDDNCGPQGSVLIVWHRDKLVGQGSAEFYFANSDKPQEAIAKVFVFTDIKSS